MILNNFSVRVPEGAETPGGYVEMEHGTQYRLNLHNYRVERCDARVEVDGKHVGTWRIEGRSSITLERPAHDTGRFTFYKIGTQEAKSAGLEESDPNLGLIRVVFTPEYKYEPIYKYNTWTEKKWEHVHYRYASSSPHTWGERGPVDTFTTNSVGVSGTLSAGGTGLSGKSGQEFGNAYQINLDYSQQTTIHLRLVARNADSGPRPLTAFSTPIPPAIR